MKLNKLSFFLAMLFLSSYSFSMEQSSNTGQSPDTNDCSTPKLTEICCKKIAQELIYNSGNTEGLNRFWFNCLKNLHSNLQYEFLRTLFKYHPDFIWQYIKNLKDEKQIEAAILSLTNLCGKTIADKLINNLHTDNKLNYLFNILQLPKELQSIILKTLFKYHPDLIWEILPDPVPVKDFVNTERGEIRRSLNISSNGRFVFTTPDKGANLWDLKAGKCLPDQQFFSSIVISYDNKLVAFQKDNKIKILDTEEDTFLPVIIPVDREISDTSPITAIAISRDNTLIAFSQFGANNIKLFNLKTYESKEINCSDFCTQLVITDNKKLVCSMPRKVTKIFNLENCKLIKDMLEYGCSDSQISPNNKYIATVHTIHKGLQVFGGGTFGDLLFTKPESEYISSLSLSPKLIAYILSKKQNAADGTVKIINLQTKKDLDFLKDEKAKIVALSPDGRLLATCTNFELKLWATETQRFIRSFKLDRMPRAIKISNNNDIIAIDFGSRPYGNGTIKIFGNI